MFAYPPQSEVNRVVPKTKIYAHARASRRLQQMFVAQVGEIVWKYKLAPETINLPAHNGIDEIQVFQIAAKQGEIHARVLQAIDKAVPFPLALEVTDGAMVRFAVSYRRRSDTDAAKCVTEAFFQTDARPIEMPRLAMPVAIDLASLYHRIIQSHIPLAPRRNEDVAAHVARFRLLEVKRKVKRQLERRLAVEKQFNRRVTLNSELRLLASEVDALQRA